MTTTQPIYMTWLNGPDVARLALTDDEILAAVETGLKAQGEGRTVIEPRVHLIPESSDKGHFNVLRGVVWPLGVAGVKIVGDFVGNFERGLPSEMALLNLFDPRTGMPTAVLDASAITDMRTGAMTALGGKYLARRDARILGHIGARGTAYWNVRLLDRLFDFDEIRVHSRRPESRIPFGERLAADLGKPVRVVDDWESCVRGADIVVEATRLEQPELLVRDEWLKPNVLLVCYGWKMVVDPRTVLGAHKVVVDDWTQCTKGGQLHPMIERGELTREKVHAEIGEIAAGLKAGRTSPSERIVFWHRGFAISDIVVGHAVLARAEAQGVGTMLTLFDQPDE